MSALQDMLDFAKSELRRYEIEYAEAENEISKNILFGYKECEKLHIKGLEIKIKVYGDDGK